MENRIFAKIIRTDSKGVFVYDGLTSRIISVALRNCTENICRDEDIISFLTQRGFLREGNFVKANLKINFEAYRNFLADEIPALVLQITRSCNLRCSYCIYSGNYSHMRPLAEEHMLPEVMIQSLDFYVAHSSNSSKADISFYGGEPLLFFPMITAGIKYAQKIFRDKLLEISISTNGLLLNEQVCQWLSDNPIVKVVITLNGSFHDRFRKTPLGKGSLGIIMNNLKLLRENFPHIFEKQTAFIANYFSFTEIAELRKFYKKQIGKPPEILNIIRRDMGNETIKKMFPVDEKCEQSARRALQKEFISNPDDTFLRLLYKARLELFDTRKIFSTEDEMEIACCLPFSVRLFVRTDGKFNICERTGDFFTLGDLKCGFNEKSIKRAIDEVKQFVNRNCAGCWTQRICLICFQNMVDENGKIRKNFPSYICEDMRQNLYELLHIYCEVYS